MAIAVYVYGIDGLLYSQILAPIPAFIYIIFILKRVISFRNKLSLESLNKLKRYSYMSITSAVLGPTTTFVIRYIIIQYLSLEMAGLWEGMNKLSSNYQTFITASCAFYLLPKFSELSSTRGIKREVSKSLLTLLPVLLLGAIILLVFKLQIIYLLFTESFVGMSDLFLWQVLGDQLKIISWLFAIFVNIQSKNKNFTFFTELISTVLQIGCAYLFIRFLSDFSCTFYYFVENITYLLLLIVIYYKFVVN